MARSPKFFKAKKVVSDAYAKEWLRYYKQKKEAQKKVTQKKIKNE